ncbi:MAG TPA: sodium:calcium antiporter [Dehalococcoidia bacterium]|nr:sodium:calcium antiporter [Dehalococcoidia bacterium]
MVWLKLVACILIIFFSGQKVAKYGDIIASRTGIGQVWMGVIAIAVITSLPELFTGISAVTIVKEPDLTVGDLLGANAFNMLNLALLDIFYRHGSILVAVSAAHRLTGLFSVILVVIVGAGILISIHVSPAGLGWVGWYTPLIILVYLLAVRQIFYYEKAHPGPPDMTPDDSPHSLRRIFVYFGIAAVCIIGAGIWLATIGDEIAAATGWGQSFVGTLFLAFTTTLPEITVSFTAMRIGASDMAVANMIGSNLFNMAILPVVDIIYSENPILSAVSEGNLVTAAAVILMTSLFVIGLRFPPARWFRFSWLNVIMIVLFILSAYFSFIAA